jgi:ferritin
MKDLIRIRSLISAEVEALLNQQVKKEAILHPYI